MYNTKEKIESIVSKVEEAKTLKVLTEKEFGIYKKYLLKGDTRMVTLHNKYHEELSRKTQNSNTEIDKKFLDTITMENYNEISLPGINKDSKKTKYSELEKAYLKYFHDRSDLTNQAISVLLGRTLKTIENIMNTLNKEMYSFGTSRSQKQKYQNNAAFYEELHGAKTILDAYCGKMSWWKNNCPGSKVHSNDLNKEIESDTHEPAEYLLWLMLKKKKTFDIVDLDSFNYEGSNEIDNAIKLANKGLILTFGDRRGLKNANSRKKNSESCVNRIKIRYNISEYNEDKIIENIQTRALEEYTKKLVVARKYSSSGVWRVYFKVEVPNIDDLKLIYNKKKGELQRLRILISDMYQEQADIWKKEEEI